MKCNFVKKVFSLFLVVVSICMLGSVSCFAAEQGFIKLCDERSDDYYMNVNNVGQIHDIYGHIDTSYYIYIGDYILIID